MTGANDRPMRDLVGGPVTRTARIPCPALYFVRHGQSTWNLQGRVQGQQDEPELTELGRQQAAGAAARLLGAARIALLLSSDLTRAVQTAEIIGEALCLTPVITPLLREQALGSLEGLNTRQATDALAGVDLTDPDRRYGGGESRNDVLARVRHLLTDPQLGRLAEGAEVALVSHGDTIRIAVAGLLGEDPLASHWRPIDNGSVSIIPATGSARSERRSEGSAADVADAATRSATDSALRSACRGA
jgi:probable phosphoglycerate mutase